MISDTTSDIIGADEAAAIIGRTKRGVYRAAARGELPLGAHWRIGRDIRFSRTKLLEWRNAGGNAAQSPSQSAA